MSVEIISEDRDDDIELNWEFIIHKSLSYSVWLFAYSLGFIFLIYLLGTANAVITAGAMIGFYLCGLLGDAVLGAAFNDDNNPPNMSKLGRFLSRFQVRNKSATAK